MFDNRMFQDRAIFLTGGGTGLGRSMALHFASLGARMFKARAAKRATRLVMFGILPRSKPPPIRLSNGLVTSIRW